MIPRIFHSRPLHNSAGTTVISAYPSTTLNTANSSLPRQCRRASEMKKKNETNSPEHPQDREALSSLQHRLRKSLVEPGRLPESRARPNGGKALGDISDLRPARLMRVAEVIFGARRTPPEGRLLSAATQSISLGAKHWLAEWGGKTSVRAGRHLHLRVVLEFALPGK